MTVSGMMVTVAQSLLSVATRLEDLRRGNVEDEWSDPTFFRRVAASCEQRAHDQMVAAADAANWRHFVE